MKKGKEMSLDVKEFNPIEFKMKFRAGFAILAFVAGLIILLVSMLNSTAQASEFTGPIIGFVTGSLFTLILSFYFGSSETSEKEPRPTITPKLSDQSNLVLKNVDTGGLSEISSEQIIPGFDKETDESFGITLKELDKMKLPELNDLITTHDLKIDSKGKEEIIVRQEIAEALGISEIDPK